MAYAVEDKNFQGRAPVLARTDPAPWGEAILAGLPFLLYPLAVYGYQILPGQFYRTANGYLIHPSSLIFWVVVLSGLAFAWRGGWRRWSASWVGYELVLLAELLLVIPTTGAQVSEGQAILFGILWLLMTIGILVLTARNDWLSGFLAVLPLMPMWYTYLALDGVAGNEAPLFYIIGLLMACIVTWIVRQGNPFHGVGWILVALMLVGLGVSYATVYFSNMRPPVGQPPTPTPGAVASSSVLFLLVYVVISCPVWVTAIVRWRRHSR